MSESRRDCIDAEIDPAIDAALVAEQRRQNDFVELIASENYVSENVLRAQGSVLTNKYADGYPGARMYGGCEHVDTVETLARERACALFGAGYANVQPYSGTQANLAAYAALMPPGGRLLGMRADHGGHITHGGSSSFSGVLYDCTQFGVSPETGLIDYDALADLARSCKPQVLVAGCSSYPRSIDWQRLRDVADDVGARLVIDMAHIAGLVAAGCHPNPVPLADVVTSTTHKTLRGPRGGLILSRDATLGPRLDAAVYPYAQGGPLMHVIAAKAVAFYEAQQPDFSDYGRRVVANAKALAARLIERGFAVVTGGTDNHIVLLDLKRSAHRAGDVERTLERAHIALNAVTLANQAGTTAGRSGLRLGTAAVTTRGFGAGEMTAIADIIADMLHVQDLSTAIESARERAIALCRRYPLYVRNAA